ncbi:MAG: hypothetical protein KAJ51_02520, partial [Thermoplasmata archaeon]|nr:hypothetical protein [Thermoplasmata archaeon]
MNSDDIIQKGNSGIRSSGYKKEPELAFASETSSAALGDQTPPVNSINEFSRGSRGELEIERNNDVNNAHRVTFTFTWTINGSLSSSDTVDWYKFQVTKGDASGNGATHFAIILSDKNTGSGVQMMLYGDNAKPPYLHRLAVSVVHDASNPNPNATPG